MCPFLFSLSQENAAVTKVIPPTLSINTSVFAVTGVATKGEYPVLFPLLSEMQLVLKWPRELI